MKQKKSQRSGILEEVLIINLSSFFCTRTYNNYILLRSYSRPTLGKEESE